MILQKYRIRVVPNHNMQYKRSLILQLQYGLKVKVFAKTDANVL